MVATVTMQQHESSGIANYTSEICSILIWKAAEDSKLGITLASNRTDEVTVINSIAPGSEASKAGALEGDTVHQINGVDCLNCNIGVIVLKTAPAGYVELIISGPPRKRVEPLHPLPKPTAHDHEIELLDAKTEPPNYAEQVASLQHMGFDDAAACLIALKATNGNVEAALERLLG